MPRGSPVTHQINLRNDAPYENMVSGILNSTNNYISKFDKITIYGMLVGVKGLKRCYCWHMLIKSLTMTSS